MEAIKNFFSNKWTIVVEGIIICLAATGLILAGKEVVDIQQLPAAAGGVVVALEGVITLIQGLFKSNKE